MREKSTNFCIQEISKNYSLYAITIWKKKKKKKKKRKRKKEKKIKEKEEVEFHRCPDLLVASQLPRYPTMLSLKQTY